jgi:hypothetical protein
LVVQLRPGNAGSNTAKDHITVTAQALAQLPDPDPRPGRRVLVRADGAGGTKDFTRWLTGRRVSYSVGFTLPMDTPVLYRLVPESVWEPALNSDGDAREGAGLADFTHRTARPRRLAGRDAGDRPPRTAPSRRATPLR